MIIVKSPARLHFGQLDLNGDLGRIYGGSGVGIEEPFSKMRFEKSRNIIVEGKKSEEINKRTKDFIEHLREKKLLAQELGVKIGVEELLPFHSGLGSGTQTALTIAEGINKLYKLELDKWEILKLVDRKHSRSAVGFGAFYYGGFIADGGRPTEEKENDCFLPPILFKNDFPDSWYFIIIMPKFHKEKISGKKEIKTFKNIEKMSLEKSAENCHHLFMGMLPALKEKNINRFAYHLNKIEDNVAEYFAAEQSGKYTSKYGQEIISFLEKEKILGRGQSSWGPTLYGIVKGKERAEELKALLKDEFKRKIDKIFVSAPANEGAQTQEIV